MTMMLTNDDGINATGLAVLADALQDLDDLLIVAPDRNCSCASQSATFGRKLKVREHRSRHGNRRVSVDGTPADAAIHGLRHVAHELPALVVSGINQGPNAGADVYHSGTIGAAREAVFFGVSSVAVSLRMYEHSSNWDTAAHFAREAVGMALEAEKARAAGRIPPRPFCLNVNIPDIPLEQVRGVRFTHHAQFGYDEMVTAENETPPMRETDLLDTQDPHHIYDVKALEKGFVSITPLLIDLTHHVLRDYLRGGVVYAPAGCENESLTSNRTHKEIRHAGTCAV